MRFSIGSPTGLPMGAHKSHWKPHATAQDHMLPMGSTMGPFMSHGKSHGIPWDLSNGVYTGTEQRPMILLMEDDKVHGTSHEKPDAPHGYSQGTSNGKPYGYKDASHGKSHRASRQRPDGGARQRFYSVGPGYFLPPGGVFFSLLSV